MADNGMPFPLAKATCFEYGIHVPLAICWTEGIKKGISDELISSVDLFPTILDAVGIRSKEKLAGNSILPYLKKQKKVLDELQYLQAGNVTVLHDITIWDIQYVYCELKTFFI